MRTVLTNEKYIGNNVYNRSSFKLKKLHVENPPDMWVRKEGAFEGIVPLEFFLTAQEIITAWSARLSDEELLDHLKRLRGGELLSVAASKDAHYALAHADALLKATPPEQRTDYAPLKPDEPKGDLNRPGFTGE